MIAYYKFERRMYFAIDPSAAEWPRRRQPESSGAAAAEKQTARRRASRNYQPPPPPKFLRRTEAHRRYKLVNLMHCKQQQSMNSTIHYGTLAVSYRHPFLTPGGERPVRFD